jgi:hypothetical protein
VQLLEQVQLWLYHDLAKKQLQLWSIRTVSRGYFMIHYTRSGGVFRLSRVEECQVLSVERGGQVLEAAWRRRHLLSRLCSWTCKLEDDILSKSAKGLPADHRNVKQPIGSTSHAARQQRSWADRRQFIHALCRLQTPAQAMRTGVPFLTLFLAARAPKVRVRAQDLWCQ